MGTSVQATKRKLQQVLRGQKNRYRAWRQVSLKKFDPIHSPVLIYQMGKVGSRSVYDSLCMLDLANPVFFVHYLSSDIQQHIKSHKNAGLHPVPYHLEVSSALRKRIQDHINKVRYKVITMVREPIAREISNFFENPSFVKDDVQGADGLIDPEKGIRYLEKYFMNPESFDYKLKWFDKELKEVFGIDVFEYPFSTEQGYQVINGSRADVLVLRIEDLSRIGEKVISDFLCLEERVSLKLSNVRTEKKEAQIYKAVKNNFRLEPQVCKKIYESIYSTHFYSPHEIEQFVQKWSK